MPCHTSNRNQLRTQESDVRPAKGVAKRREASTAPKAALLPDAGTLQEQRPRCKAMTSFMSRCQRSTSCPSSSWLTRARAFYRKELSSSRLRSMSDEKHLGGHIFGL